MFLLFGDGTAVAHQSFGMAGSTRGHRVSIVGAVGSLYAALAAIAGLVVLFTGATGLGRTVAFVMLATVALYFGRAAVGDLVHLAIARKVRSLGSDVRDALSALGSDFRVTQITNDELEREDHVVAGPTGVFVIVAAEGDRRAGASHRRLFSDSRAWWRDMIEDCHIEALRVGERLRRSLSRPVTVHPVLCLGSGLVTVGRVVRGVRVVHMQELARVLASLPPIKDLDPRQVERASAALGALAQVIPLRPRTRGEDAPSETAAPGLTSV